MIYSIETLAKDPRIIEVIQLTGEVDGPDSPFVVAGSSGPNDGYTELESEKVVGVVPEGLRHLFHYVEKIDKIDVGISDEDEKIQFVIGVRHYFFHLLRKELKLTCDKPPIICRNWQVVAS